MSDFVMECPECEHRVLVEAIPSHISPTVWCGCGEVAIMDEVHRV